MDTSHLLHFLLAEDDDDHAELIRRSLRRHRVCNSIDRVTNGVDVLAYLRNEGEFSGRPRPDVVLLDINMPRMGGLEALDYIKADEALREIPVVMLTTSDAETDRARAYRSYANSYLVKPLDFEQFVKLVDELAFYWGVWNRPARNV